ncbi:MAG: type II toxin-antitoxin system VapC family toxin [Deltaproteobacteria bacterium]|nr:type II toxin-antitoxin system VapC family toxin [Deltaproteobacteria bacterium]
MKFWDASAIIPLLIEEKTSSRVRDLLTGDSEVFVWTLTPVECFSALFRRHREKPVPVEIISQFRKRLAHMEKAWIEITQVELVKRRAERILASHRLRAADAMQLAAALVAFTDQPENGEFITFDETLAGAAALEGFVVLP